MAPSILLKAAALLALLAIGALIGVSCIPERRQPAPPTPQTQAPSAVLPDLLTRDLAGHVRDPERGITPGALEAEVGRPATTRTN